MRALLLFNGVCWLYLLFVGVSWLAVGYVCDCFGVELVGFCFDYLI